MGLGEILSLGSAMVWAAAVIMFKRSGETFSPLALNLFKNAIAIVLLAATIPFFHGFALPDLPAAHWWILIISGVLGIGIADGLYFAALNTIGASRTGVASSLYSPFVIALSFTFLGERLGVWQLLGFVLVVIAVVALSLNPDRQELSEDKLRRGIPIAVTAVFLMAAGVVMVKPVLATAEFLWVVQIRLVAAVIMMLVWAQMRGGWKALAAEYRADHHWPRAVIASILGGYVALVMWLAGYKYAPASVASVLNETASVFILVLAWLFLDERMDRRKVGCVVLSFSGVVLLTLGG